MGANAQIEVPAFTAGQVLTAAEMTQVNTGIPVFATTVTRDAAFGGTGEKVLAEGQFAYIEATNTTQYYDGSAWVAVGASGLTLVKSQTIGSAVGSVTVTDAFSATYDNYLVTINGGAASTNLDLYLTLGATATGYSMNLIYTDYNATVTAAGNTNQTSFRYAGVGNTTTLMSHLTLQNPFLTEFTYVFGNQTTTGFNGSVGGYLNNTTSYTALTFTPSAGTITGGTIRVYGYANS